MTTRGTMHGAHGTHGLHGGIGSARTLQDCEAICVQTMQYCLEMGGAHVEPQHMQLLQDCADICDVSGSFHFRGSAQCGGVTQACADICEMCAASCERFVGDPQMKACANQCHLCAAACRQMLSGALGGAPQGQPFQPSQPSPRQPG